MQKAYIIRGRVSDARHVELDEPIDDVGREVQVLLLAPAANENPTSEDVFDFIRKLEPGTRTKEDIDRQVKEERDQWGD